jgi:uncharacterized protein (DUF362 family)
MDGAGKARVAIGAGRDRIEAADNAMAALGGIENWVKPGDRVLLKPNIMSAGSAPMITHIDLLKGLYCLLKDAGASEVIVGENSVCGLSPRKQMDYTGYHQALLRLGCKVVFFDEDEWVYCRCDDNVCLQDMHLPRSLVEADLWITVPVMKTHIATGSTLGLKNSHGILADEDKARHHRTRPASRTSLWDKFVDILAAARPDLCVMDAFEAMEGQGPSHGHMVQMGLVLASDDVVACDAVTDALMGFANLESPLPRIAHQRGLGIADMERIEVVGEPLEKHRRDFIKAVPGDEPGHDPEGLVVLRGDVCRGGCGMPLCLITDTFKKVIGPDLADLGPLYVLCGLDPPEPPDDRFIFVFGDCAIYSTWHMRYRRRPARIGPWWKPKPGYVEVPGCPPLSLVWIREFAKLVTGYAPMMSMTSLVDFVESATFTFGEGVPLEKNPRRWQWDPAFKKRYAKEIAQSGAPDYIYDDERVKGGEDCGP